MSVILILMDGCIVYVRMIIINSTRNFAYKKCVQLVTKRGTAKLSQLVTYLEIKSTQSTSRK